MNANKPILCYFCGKPILNFEGVSPNAHVLHHKDGDHKNWRISNLANAHKKCYGSHHYKSWWDSLLISERQTMIESATERLETFRVNNPGFLRGRKLSEETKRKISTTKKELWSRVSVGERRKIMRKCWEASPMNKKGRPPTARIAKRDEIGRIVKSVAIS